MDLLEFIERQSSIQLPNTLAQKFEQYHKDNPHVYKLFLKYAKQVKSLGFDRFSSKAIFERLRWHLSFETKDYDSAFKINNNYTSFYARKVMSEYPEFINFFETRTQKDE